MLYLLDANVLIRAHEDYYPLDRVRPFWDWLIVEAAAGHTKMPFEIYDEIASSEWSFEGLDCEVRSQGHACFGRRG